VRKKKKKIGVRGRFVPRCGHEPKGEEKRRGKGKEEKREKNPKKRGGVGGIGRRKKAFSFAWIEEEKESKREIEENRKPCSLFIRKGEKKRGGEGSERREKSECGLLRF